jgi:6-phosphofructokinase
MESFLMSIKKEFLKYGRCVVAVSEGIQNTKGELFAEKIKKKNEFDDHGNIQLSGSGMLGDYLANEVKKKLKISRVRADTLGYSQRCFLGAASEVDQLEAYQIGLSAVNFSINFKNSFSVGIKERKNFKKKYEIEYIINSLKGIAGKTKVMPKKFFDKKNYDVTKDFINYCKPLIGKKIIKTTSII